MHTIIERNNQTYNLDELNIFTRDFIVSSPEYRTVTETIEGADGEIDLGTTIAPRKITVVFYFKADDLNRFPAERDEVFLLFESTEPFYIIDSRSPFEKWLVKVESPFEIEQVLKYGLFEVTFIAHSGKAESIGTTLMARTFEHLQDLPVTHTDYKDIYAVKFKIYNAGDVIDPRNVNHMLKITYKGNSENLRIKNLTTDDEWAYNGISNLEDEIVLEGIRSTKNGLSIFRQTNKRLITLEHGWNEFEIHGAPDAREYAVQANLPRKRINEIDKKNPITFEFKFLF